MACSKIFSGDLPELIYEIIQYFQNDFSTLYSCILINRLWCRLAIPLLWKDPFSFPTKNYHFIEIYLNNLNPPNPLFNYPNFITRLNIYQISNSVEKWTTKNFPHLNKLNRRKVIKENFKKILTLISSNCNSISTLYLNIYNEKSIKIYSQIINSQQNLKTILLDSNIFPLYNSLKTSNCSNTLKKIIFYCIDFKNIVILNEVFEQLNVLQSIHILYCLSLNSNFIQQINNPFKLKSLFMGEKIQIESFHSLLQKSSDHLENIGFDLKMNNESKQQLLKLITKYCAKIKFFDLCGFNNQNIYSTFAIIKNIGQNLNYLTINFYRFRYCDYSILNDIEDHYLSSIVLQGLGQILPFKLEYLSLSLKIDASDFEVFLKNSQNAFIKKLLIRNKMYHVGNEDILPCIKEHIMKKKRVKYLAIEEIFIDKRRDLFSFKDQVKEFELYNIKVQHYNDLEIQVCNFICEML